ncbi:MAG: ribonuclease [Solirubrobacterales bacterium]|nr:ribonuclease [Solirubrobacterales bacterium]
MRDSTLRSSAGVRRALSRFWHKAYGDGITGLAGMVAYNLLLSLLPLTLLALFIFGQVVGSGDVETSVIRDVQRILPATSEGTIHRLLSEIRRSSTSIGIAALLSSVWIGASFWGALDTAFCRIYGSPCRTWLQQKRFALGMLLVVLVLFAATVAVPAVQSAVADGARDLPFGLSASSVVYAFTLAATVAVLFCALAVVYRLVPNWRRVPWRGVWPGALGATIAMAIVDNGIPLYLQGSVFTSFGGTYVFIILVLVWFYAIALIMLAGAVINALRLEGQELEAHPS